jgi:hypothetical protein
MDDHKAGPNTQRCSGPNGDQQNKWHCPICVILRPQPKNLVADRGLLPERPQMLLFARATQLVRNVENNVLGQ